MLYANSLGAILISVAVGVLFWWSQWTVMNQKVLVVWFTVFFTISIARLILLVLYKRKNPSVESLKRWNRYFLIGICGISILYGTSSFFLYPDNNPSGQTVFFLVITGLATGGITSLCSSFPAVSIFVSLTLLPLAFKMFTFHTSNSSIIGILVLIFWAVILFGARRLNINIQNNIGLRIQSIERETILKSSEERYRHIFKTVPLGIFQYNSNSLIIDCNDAFITMLDAPKDALIGMNILEEVKERGIINAIQESLTTGNGYFEGEYSSILSPKTLPIRAFLKAIRTPDNEIIGGVGIVEDFTEKRLTKQQVRYHATYDTLTGLPNRRLILNRLRVELSRSRRHGQYGALLFIDLDNFKTVNDSLGHSAGDELLKQVAIRLSKSIRKEDSVARMGGDEFIIILTELGKTSKSAADKAKKAAEKLCQCVSKPCKIESQVLHITLSVGISLFPKPETEVDDILKQADTAMYRAKDAGRNEVRFFLPSMQAAADKKLQLSTELRTALINNEFILFYQPQVDTSGKVLGAEALIRWDHPVRGLISPADFLPVAEETGIMLDLGKWIIRSVCQQISNWSHLNLLKKYHVISVNISGKELTAPDFTQTIAGVLKETGTPPAHLGIELTEGSLISTGEDIVQKIMTLRELGIKFSIDDFGTGYSSLNYLKKLPINTLKIDRSFVTDIKDANHDIVLVDTIIMMAHNLGLDVIAEGIENLAELQYLENRGCTTYQGFYFSKPVSVATFTEMLKKENCHLTDHPLSKT